MATSSRWAPEAHFPPEIQTWAGEQRTVSRLHFLEGQTFLVDHQDGCYGSASCQVGLQEQVPTPSQVVSWFSL